ncbi:MAG: bifunctional UDP-sugar hydrolase/5'-nucleotidase [Opitutaceae bacterium]
MNGFLRSLGVSTLLVFGCVPFLSAERAQITVLSTTDLHGHIYPVDYGTNQPSADGLARVATLIRAARKDAPQLILIDCGDTIQGTPLAYYHNRINNAPVDPMMLAMNALGFASLTLGNHEYNFGLAVLEKARKEASFPWLSANIYKTGSTDPVYTPYLVREVQGVRVGILGLTTPGVPSWENEANYAGLTFAQPVAAARRWVELLRKQERVDVLVVAMHMGLEENLSTGIAAPGQVPDENAALAIARAVPGIDLIFMGHTHREVAGLSVGGALLTQAGRWGDRLARADVYLDRPNPQARWTVVAKSSVTVPVTLATTPDPEILALVKPYHDETQAWLSQPLGRSARKLSSREARLKDTAIIDLIQRVQLDAGRADVSFTAAFSLNATLPEGPVTVREIAGLYVYENTLVTIELTGAQVKAALEHSGRYYLPYLAGKSPAELADPTIPGYNFDIAEGVEYTLDLTRPQGDRITDLRFQGAPLDPKRVLKVAINNYRLNGGGGYTMFRGAKVLDRSNVEIRDLIIEWVRRHPDIPAEPTQNWKLLPAP